MELREGGVFVWQSGEAVVIFFELVIGGLELRNALCEVLKVGKSFLEEFPKEGRVGGEFLLSFGKFFGVKGVDPLVEGDKIVRVGLD